MFASDSVENQVGYFSRITVRFFEVSEGAEMTNIGFSAVFQYQFRNQERPNKLMLEKRGGKDDFQHLDRKDGIRVYISQNYFDMIRPDSQGNAGLETSVFLMKNLLQRILISTWVGCMI